MYLLDAPFRCPIDMLCNPDERCTPIIDTSECPVAVGCYPNGPVSIGGACTYSEARGDVLVDDCARGAMCVQRTCRQICDPTGGMPPREVRNALRYVLNNALHHDPNITFVFGHDWIDPCSSAPWFDGWARPIATDVRWKRELVQQPRPTVKPRSWLLRVGWRRHGAIRFDEMPGTKVDRELAQVLV